MTDLRIVSTDVLTANGGGDEEDPTLWLPLTPELLLELIDILDYVGLEDAETLAIYNRAMALTAKPIEEA